MYQPRYAGVEYACNPGELLGRNVITWKKVRVLDENPYRSKVDVTVCVVAVVQELVAAREAEDTGRALDRQNNQGYEHEVSEEENLHAPRENEIYIRLQGHGICAQRCNQEHIKSSG